MERLKAKMGVQGDLNVLYVGQIWVDSAEGGLRGNWTIFTVHFLLGWFPPLLCFALGQVSIKFQCDTHGWYTL